MRDAAVIVESVVDVQQLARSIAKEHIALQDCDRSLEATERKSEGLREQQRRHRVEIGRLLVEAKRGIKHGGWLPYLEKLGINDQNARNWMALAGHVESKTNADVLDFKPPTLADAGRDSRPRKSESAPSRAPTPSDEQPDPPHREPEPTTDVGDARAVESSLLTMVSNALGTVARQWPGDLRRLADELRRFADKLERRAKE